MTEVSDKGAICLYGVRVQLPLKTSGLHVVITLRANGQFAVIDAKRKVICEGAVPPANMNQFRRDEGPREEQNLHPPQRRRVPEDFLDINDIF